MLKDNWPCYLTLAEASELLSKMGLKITQRQLQRAAEKNAAGQRRLPFFVDPIDGRLKIDKHDLVRTYRSAQIEAHKNLRPP